MSSASSFQPSRDLQGTRSSGAQQPDLWPHEMIVREGVLEDPETGAQFQVRQTDSSAQVLLQKAYPERHLSVLSVVPTQRYSGLTTSSEASTASASEESAPPIVTRVGSAQPNVRERLRRRVEEHRIQVERLRKEFGDPAAALDKFVVSALDQEAAEAAYAQLLDETGTTTEDLESDARQDR